MKITILHGGCYPIPPVLGGGVEKVWHRLAIGFAGHGHQVTQISRRYPGLPDLESRDGVTHLRIPGYDAPGSFARLLVKEFLYSLNALRFLPRADILVTHSIWAPLLARARRFGRLYVHVARFPKGQMRFYRHAARLQTVSRTVADAIRRELPAADHPRLSIIPYPHGQPENEALPRWADRRPRILFVGRVHPEKGVHLLVQAFADLAGAHAIANAWTLHIVGPVAHSQGGGGEDYLARLGRLAAKAPDRIELAGPEFDAGRLAVEYRRARLFVYPSLAETGETFGIAPLEAMANGCPTLVSALACFQDFIRPGDNGFVFDHRASAPEVTLGDSLRDLLAPEPSPLPAAAARALATARTFDLECIVGRYLQDFHAVLAERPDA